MSFQKNYATTNCNYHFQIEEVITTYIHCTPHNRVNSVIFDI